MPTITDVLRMNPIQTLDSVGVEKHLTSFLEEFQPWVSFYMDKLAQDRDFMEMISVSVLAQGDDNGVPHSMGRLQFKGIPIALFRHTPERHPTWTWRLVDDAYANDLVANILSHGYGERMAITQHDDDAADLFEFGPHASFDPASGEVSFMTMTPVMTLHSERTVMVLSRGEDGSVVLKQQDHVGDVHVPMDDMHAGVSTFLRETQERVDRFPIHSGIVIFSVGDNTLFLTYGADGARLDMSGGPNGKTVNVTRGGGAVSEFSDMLREAGRMLEERHAAPEADESRAPGM